MGNISELVRFYCGEAGRLFVRRDTFYIIAHGHVRVSIQSKEDGEDGKELTLTTMVHQSCPSPASP